MPVRVTLYSKPGCHLCDIVERKLLVVRQRIAFDLEIINILEDQALVVKYGFDIPVVMVNGNLFCTHFMDEEAFERLLKEVSE